MWNAPSVLRAFRDAFHNGSFLTLLCSVSDFKPDMEDVDLIHDVTVTAFNIRLVTVFKAMIV